MKNFWLLCVVLLALGCQRQAVVKNQDYPHDLELFDTSKDAIAAKKPKPPKNPQDTSRKIACVYLDFDGEVVTSTVWASSPIVCENSGLTAMQRSYVWDKVKTGFAGLSIKVTDSLSVFNSYPINKRVRVIITQSSEWFPYNAGGVAYVGSYLWGDDTPCFVFSNKYGLNPDYIAHASIHEPGHTFGLRHQSVYDDACNKTMEYRPGWNMGQFWGWPSIFGIGTSSLGCNILQDDIATIINNL